MAKRKQFIGTVTSDKMQETVVVKVERLYKHPKYGRIVKKYNKFKAHNEKGIAKLGDLVRIEETRPISKDKRFRVLEILQKSKSAHVQLKEEAV